VKDAGAEDSTPVLGAVLAACLGNSQAFRAALYGRALPGSARLSLWNLRGSAAALDGPKIAGGELGSVYLVGCGAVGSAIAHLMPLVGLNGIVSLVDGDSVDPSNLNRAPLFVAADLGLPKVEVVTSYLRRNGIAVRPHTTWFDDAVHAGDLFRDRPDLVIPTANDRGVRLAIQDQVPPLQIYGTTGRNWDAFLGRHIPVTEDCLACRFPEARIEGEPPLVCSTARIQASPAKALVSSDAALPFLSTVAGVLAVAEILKATGDGGYPLGPNFACLDLRGDLDDFALDQRLPNGDCRCTTQRRISPVLNGLSRFARFPVVRTGAGSSSSADRMEPTGAGCHSFIGGTSGDGLPARRPYRVPDEPSTELFDQSRRLELRPLASPPGG